MKRAIRPSMTSSAAEALNAPASMASAFHWKAEPPAPMISRSSVLTSAVAFWESFRSLRS